MPLALRSSRLTELIFAVAGALVALVLAGAASTRVWPARLDIGGEDAYVVESFHAPERSGDQTFRWTDGNSRLSLPPLPPGAPGVLSLRLADARPSPPPGDLVVRAGGAEVARLRFADDRARVYWLLAPPQAAVAPALTVQLEGPTRRESAEGRELGVALFEAALVPGGSGLRLPSAWAMVWSAAFGVLAYAAARLWGARPRAALVTVAGLSAVIALACVARPLDVVPHLQRFAGAAAVAVAGLAAIRALVPLRAVPTAGSRARAPHLVVAGEHVPIVLGLAAWSLLLFELVLIAEGVPLVPAAWTFWTGMGLAAFLAIGVPAWWVLVGRGLAPAERGARRARLVLWALAVAAVVHLAFSVGYAFTRQAPDFWILFRGAREWTRGGSLYDLQAVRENHFGHVFKVPPFYGMLFVPFIPRFGGEVVLLFHRWMNVALICATALVWLRMWRISPLSLAGAGLLILLNFRPLADTLAFGQIDLVLLFLLTAALWALRAGRDGLAGALIALGTLFKIYPVVLLAFLVLKGRWAALWGFALGMLVFNGLAVAVMGWEMHRVYVTQVLPNIGGTTSWLENQTLSGFFARLASSPMAATIFEGRALRLIGTAVSGAVVLAVCALTLRPAPARSPAFALQYGMFLLLMVLTVPAAWMHYQTLLVVPFGALLLALRDREVSLGYALALGLSFALISYGNQWTFLRGPGTGLLATAGVSYKLYGMLLLAGLSGIALLAERRATVDRTAPPEGGMWGNLVPPQT